MAAIVSEESGVGKSVEGISSGQRCHSGETLAEWRSSEQVENGITSTSPPYWDTDDEHDSGPKPSELYGKYTWKIEKFSQITKRELRSNAFEVGGYKWYILIYPQGCDVCNHLSLFLCVANHDKLLPGWSHFAQFTIAVINKDPKKSKYSDTLHRFWKKEHDWGWKKFMELSKVYDGFVDTSDNLIIKAQVQVIREKSDRPFRCLDCQYRRELVRVYLTNVEQICRRFVEERRSKLGKLIEDKARWSSFFAFWREIDQTSRRRMSREKTDVILKVVVKHFFIEKEVTSTLVMDSLHSGLKALEGQTKCKKGRVKSLDAEEMPAPIIRVEKDMFVLMDDVLLLLERAAVEPLPPKEEKGPQNRTKDVNSGEDINKDSIERDERRLTELGRRTLEIFVLAHIFSNKIEVAYQEAVALKRQEELIREEEAAWQAESDQRAKRGVNMKSKKKQAKPKRNNRKGKDKGRDERTTVAAYGKNQEDTAADEKKDSNMDEPHTLSGKPDAVEDVSDVSDSVDGVTEILQPDSEDRDASPVNWDTDASEAHLPAEACNNGLVGDSSMQNGMSDKRSSSVVDDSSSTCSNDSVPSVITNDPYKGASFSNYKVQKSPSRGKSQGKASREVDSWTNEMDSHPSGSVADAVDTNSECGSGKVGESESEGAAISLRDRLKWAEQHVVRKVEEMPTLLQKQNSKDQVAIERPIDNESQRKENISAVPSSPVSPVRNTSAVLPSPISPVSGVHVRKTSSCGSQQTDKDASSPLTSTSQVTSVSKTEILKTSTTRLTERSVAQVPMMSRPSSAPLVPGPSRPTAPVVSMVQTAPPLSRSVSAAGRLGPDPSPATHSYVPQSYRNAIMGNHVASTAASLTHSSSSSSGVNPSPGYSQPSPLVSSPIFLSHGSDRRDSNAGQSGVPFGMIAQDVLQKGSQWIESSQSDVSRRMQFNQPSTGLKDVQNHDLCRAVHSRSMSDLSTEFPACTSGRQNQGLLVDEFPHLDIINDLLDDEHGIVRTTKASSVFQPLNSGPEFLNRQFTFPGDLGANDDVGSSSSSCRFERSRSYHHDNGFRGGYSSAGGHFDSLGDFIPQMGSMPYVNGQVDGLIPNQWQVAGSGLLYPGMRNSDNDGFSYYPDYSNMGCGINGYTVFRPSNGH